MPWHRTEYETKLQRIRSFLEAEEIAGVLIQSQAAFTWLTGARTYINMLTESACASLLVTADRVCLITNNIEAERLMTEELTGLPLERLVYPWWEPAGAITGAAPIRTEAELGTRFARLRWILLPEETARFARLGEQTAAVLDEVAYTLAPGLTEEQVAGLLRQQSAALGLDPAVVLVGADDRASRYRHPLPTGKAVEKYALMAICARKDGLVASATRLIHFGKVPAELRRRHEAVTKVDVALIGMTRPGRTAAEVFAAGAAAYADVGFPEEWKHHHQGGLAGYLGREFKAAPDSAELVAEGQVYAWNPTIAGVKSEDTILVGDGGPRILTGPHRFPMKLVEYRGYALERPDILER